METLEQKLSDQERIQHFCKQFIKEAHDKLGIVISEQDPLLLLFLLNQQMCITIVNESKTIMGELSQKNLAQTNGAKKLYFEVISALDKTYRQREEEEFEKIKKGFAKTLQDTINNTINSIKVDNEPKKIDSCTINMEDVVNQILRLKKYIKYGAIAAILSFMFSLSSLCCWYLIFI